MSFTTLDFSSTNSFYQTNYFDDTFSLSSFSGDNSSLENIESSSEEDLDEDKGYSECAKTTCYTQTKNANGYLDDENNIEKEEKCADVGYVLQLNQVNSKPQNISKQATVNPGYIDEEEFEEDKQVTRKLKKVEKVEWIKNGDISSMTKEQEMQIDSLVLILQ